MAIRKQPAKRSAVKAKTAKAEAPVVAQPAAERRSAEAQLSALIEKYTPGQSKVIGAIRKALSKRLPTAHQIVYEYNGFYVVSYSPSDHGYQGVLALRGDANGIRLYVTGGKELADPAKLLRKASGVQRWIDLEGASTLARPEVVSLLDAAIALNDASFAREGDGAVVVSASTKKRQGRSS